MTVARFLATLLIVIIGSYYVLTRAIMPLLVDTRLREHGLDVLLRRRFVIGEFPIATSSTSSARPRESRSGAPACRELLYLVEARRAS